MKPNARTLLLSLVVVMCIALGAGPAWAQPAGQGLATVGPLMPGNLYPTHYVDKQNPSLALEQCLTSPVDPAAPVPDPCGLTGTLPLGDLTPIVFPSNFPIEFFYSRAVAKLSNIGGVGGRSTLVLALEGGFTAPLTVATPGQQVVFTRLRVNVTNGLVPGATYTVTHPYGTITFIAEPDGSLPRNAGTTDFGCLIAPCGAFDQVLPSPIFGPFLQAVDPAPPAGYVGNPAIDQTITGSPTGNNFFRIEGPDVGGPNVNVVETPFFNIWGKLYTGPVLAPVLSIDKSSYVRSNAGTTINVFARSTGDATLTTPSIPGGPNLALLAKDATAARFFGQLSAALPADMLITVTATNAGGQTTMTSPLVDEVIIDAATYNTATQTLTIQAHSGDVLGAPTLAAESEEAPPVPLGTLASGGVLTVTTAAPPVFVVVRSPFGGSDIRAVDASPGGGGGQTSTTTSLVSSLNPSELGQPVTFTATIGVVGSPSGTITFTDGATVLGTRTVTNKTASFIASALAIGSHSITATYSGDAVFSGSTSNAVAQVVGKATTTLTLGGNPNPSALGQPVTFASSVTAAPAAGIPTGTVTFFDGGTAMAGCANVPVGSGLASCTYSGLSVGSHTITSTYSGDASFKPAVSPIFTQTVGAGTGSTTLTVSPNPVLRKAAVTYTATVNPTNLSAGGTVTFSSAFTDNKGVVTTTVIGTAVVNASGVATLTAPAPNQRATFSITAAYGGNANVGPSTSGAVSLVVQ
jgi:Big-like domain-containing protein